MIAKELDAPYRPGERKGMVKIKRLRTIDAVVAGWRPGKEPNTVGSLMLGLYDGDELRVVGHTSGLKAAEKRELVETLAPYETGERGSADPSRWAADRDLEWVSLRPELVIEVSFDHVSAGRIRHGSKILRWREDKDPRTARSTSSRADGLVLLRARLGCDPLRLALLLAEVRRPGRVAEPLLLVLGGQLEQLLEAAGVLVDVRRGIAERRAADPARSAG